MASAHPMTDHEEIRRWAEARGAKPACVRNTGRKGDVGMIRLDFPGFSGARSLQPISWDDWFKSFDANNLALLVQEKTARGQQSNFNKLVSRGAGSQSKAAGARQTARSRSAGGARKTARSRPTSSRGRTAASRRKSSSRTHRTHRAGGGAERHAAADRPARGRRGKKIK